MAAERSDSSPLRAAAGLVELVIVLVAAIFFWAGIHLIPGYIVFILFFSMAFGAFIGCATLVHELGHALCGRLAGWRIIVITVWPFALHVPTLRLVVNSKVSTEDGGGYVCCVPGSKAAATRFRHILFSLGGPAASLAAAIICWAIATAPPTPADTDAASHLHHLTFIDRDQEQQIADLLYAFGLLNLRAFIGTVIPMRYRSGKISDGMSILRSLKGKDPVDGTWSLWIALMLHYRVRLRDVPNWMYASARAGAAKFGEDMSLHDAWDIARALDAKTVRPDRVRSLIAAYRTAYGDSDWLLNCDAWLAAIHENDVEHAERALALRKGGEDGKAMQAAADAAVAAKRGQHAMVEKNLWWLDQELRAESAFPNTTFRDIRKTIESAAAIALPATA